MSKRTTGLLAIAAGVILGIGRTAAAQEPTIAGHHERPHHIFLIGKAHSTVEDAMQGAMRRLAMPRCRQGGEIMLIHELLHALGLGENPATSARITDAVMNRCG